MKALGEAATHLPWICPRASSLVALARSPTAGLWRGIRSDPGAVLLVIRQAAATQALPSLSFFPALLQDPIILQEAIARLPETGPAFVDWSQESLRPIYQASLIFARLAENLAERTGRSDPDNAWVAGLLAPLGWLAIAALEPASAAACLADPRLPTNPLQAQQDHWGIDQAAIARRLCRRWQLPAWLTAIAGHLDLSWEAASGLGADPDLFRIVQLTVVLVQRQGVSLLLQVGSEPLAAAESLGIPECELASLEREIPAWIKETDGSAAENLPVDMALLRDLLTLAAENRRLINAPIVQALEQEVDQLHRAFLAQTASEQARLHALKLSALAEFAAGAGHEINNPLAVISGQAQYLLNHEPEPARQRALQAIIGQTQRIHQTLNAMMQFARPSPAQKQSLNVIDLVQEVTASLTDLAAQRRIQLIGDPQASPVYLQIDDRQVKTALTCLLRNAIEAAPAEGWAKIRLETSAPDRLEIMVEDNGPGPLVAQREHLFDPFFSGRQAGRGKGLGLSIAWRLARQNGGEVRYEELPGGPTRFVLSLPRTESPNGASTDGHAEPLSSLAPSVSEVTVGGRWLGANGQ